MLRDNRIAQEREAELARRSRRMAADYGNYFSKIKPDWFLTITFDREPVRDRALKALKAYLRELEEAAGQPIAWILAEDRGKLGQRLHAHLLIAGVAHLNRKRWWRIAHTRFGRTRLEPFDDTRGGAYYVAQNGLSEFGELHFGGKLLDEKAVRERSTTASTTRRDLQKTKKTKVPGPPNTAAKIGRVVVAKSAAVPSALFHMNLGRNKQR